MFIIEIHYSAPLTAIDEALEDHKAWLDEQYDAGLFLASGRQEPRTGGIIIAADQPRDQVETIVRRYSPATRLLLDVVVYAVAAGRYPFLSENQQGPVAFLLVFAYGALLIAPHLVFKRPE